MSSDTVNSSSTRLVHTARNKRPWPNGNTRNDKVPSTSKSSEAKKNVIVEDHRRNLSLSKNQQTISSERNNIKLAIRNDKYEIVCGTCKQCFVTYFTKRLRTFRYLRMPLEDDNVKRTEVMRIYIFPGTVRNTMNHYWTPSKLGLQPKELVHLCLSLQAASLSCNIHSL
nr:hypothetical protein [Tanacetum cinerariifolium]